MGSIMGAWEPWMFWKGGYVGAECHGEGAHLAFFDTSFVDSGFHIL